MDRSKKCWLMRAVIGSVRPYVFSDTITFEHLSLTKTKGIIRIIRAEERKEGKPTRKLKPVTTWLLIYAIRSFLENYDTNKYVLKKVEVSTGT